MSLHAVMAFITLTLTLAMGEAPSHAQTPEGAAAASVYAGSAPIRVVRINVAGNFAAVLMSGAMIEGSPEDAPILLEKFPFGWQALESLNFRCRLRSHSLGANTEALLMRGMPRLQDEQACSPLNADVGPATDIITLRRAAKEPFVPQVRVKDGYAVVDWYGVGGGRRLYRKRDGEWTLLQGGGGDLGASDMRILHVPQAAWCALGVDETRCAKGTH